MTNNAFFSKAIFAHKLYSILNGDAQSIATLLKDAGITCIQVKAAEGAYAYVPNGYLNVTKSFVDTMHSNGISVIGWGFCYGSGDNEGLIAAQQVNNLGLDGWGFDIESSFEGKLDAVQRAGQTLGTYQKNVVDKTIPTAFVSWALWRASNGSQIHNIPLAKFWMNFELTAVGMPMIYWNKLVSGSPVQMTDTEVLAYYNRSITSWNEVTPKPIIPVGRAYTGDAGFINPTNITAFANKVKENHSGISWWFLDQSYKIADAWAALQKTPTYGEATPPPEPPQVDTVSLKNITPLPKEVTYVTVTVNNKDHFFSFTPAPTIPPVVIPPTNTNLYRVASERWPELHGIPQPDNGGPLVQVSSGSPKGGKFSGPLASDAQSFIQSWNNAAGWDKISADNFGPSQGIDPISLKLKWNYLIWPSNTSEPNFVNVLEFTPDGLWAIIETIPLSFPVPADITPTNKPWLFHKVCDNRGNPVIVNGLPIICPLFGNAKYVPMRALIK